MGGYGISDGYSKLERDGKGMEIGEGECGRLVGCGGESLNRLDEIGGGLGEDGKFGSSISNELGSKGNKCDVYSKSEGNNKINSGVGNKVSCRDVSEIKIVDEIGEVGSESGGILYIKVWG